MAAEEKDGEQLRKPQEEQKDFGEEAPKRPEDKPEGPSGETKEPQKKAEEISKPEDGPKAKEEEGAQPERKPQAKEEKELTPSTPASKAVAKKKIGKMTLDEVEEKLQQVKGKMGGWSSKYAQELLKRRQVLKNIVDSSELGQQKN